jgi:glycosyltransferase involved in cell wall biosynthesis
VSLTYTVVIPTFDRPHRARAAVEAVLDQSRLPTRIVVVDASERAFEPDMELAAAAQQAGVVLDVVSAPASTAGQRNRGVDLATTPVVLLLDDDVTLETGYVEVLLMRWEAAGLEAFGAMVGVPEHVPHQGVLVRILRRGLMLHYQAPRAKATRMRRSRKLRLVPIPATEVQVEACGAGYGLFRADLLRRHPFDERFAGYAPGEDLDMSSRLAAEAPILQVPSVRYLHEGDPRERVAPQRWRLRGRRETYFRLKHLDDSALSRAAFYLSLFAESGVAAAASLRERDSRYVRGYVAGVRETLNERRRDSADCTEPWPRTASLSTLLMPPAPDRRRRRVSDALLEQPLRRAAGQLLHMIRRDPD